MSRNLMPPALADARTLWGEPRFYPAGQHPAAERSRRQLAHLDALYDRGLDTTETRQAREYLEREVYMVEYGELAAKLAYLGRLARRPAQPSEEPPPEGEGT